MSVSTTGKQGDESSFTLSNSSVSADGRFVAFTSYATNLVGGDTNGTFDVFVRDRTFQKTYRVSISASGFQANGAGDDPSISADGHFVAFESSPPTLWRATPTGWKTCSSEDHSGEAHFKTE